jgi:CIC family chloride channel protein
VKRRRPSERLRTPSPLIRTRLPSGRGATEQPNATGDGDAALTLRFWLLVVLTGLATGLLGDLMMLILFNVQFWAFGYHHGTFEAAVTRSSDARRLIVLLIAGGIGGPAWFLLRRFTAGEKSDVDDSLWAGDGTLSFRRSLGTSVISEVVIGMGASIGRENAPKLMGAVSGSLLAGWAGLTPAQKRLLVACGGGAGMAAVYNVPLGGAIFAAEVLVGSIRLPTVLPALVCSFVATVTSWLYLPTHPTYVDIPSYAFNGRLLVWALVFGPVIGAVAAAYIRLVGWVTHHPVTGRWALVALIVACGIVGLLGFQYPQLFGNGQDMARDAFVGIGSLGLLAALSALKPIATALCLGGRAAGGLFTPVLSTGAVFGGFCGLAWSHLWPGSPVGAYAMIGAAAMIGAGIQAPLAALALVLELTHSTFSLMVPMMAATAIATAVCRLIDGYSIYTARLPAAQERPHDRAPAAT